MEFQEQKNMWKSNGAGDVAVTQLFRVKDIVDKYKYELTYVEPEKKRLFEMLDNSFDERNENNNYDDILDKYTELNNKHTNPLYLFEIFTLADIITMMFCIDLEMRVNKFCYYNIGNETTEAIESLSTIKKLTVAHAVLGKIPFKGTKIYQLLNEFVTWRNKYAHGKRPEIKDKELHKNHFKDSNESICINKTVMEIIEKSEKFLKIVKYLREISISEYTSCILTQDEDIEFIISYLKNIEEIK